MATGNFVAYYRVSTAEQGASGLGIEAQRAAVTQYLNGGSWTLLSEFTEIESGKHNTRPQLAAALRQCRLTGAKLVIAKLDRLSRNVAFLSALMDGATEFVACDNPHATRFTLHILAAVAEHEAAMISSRTKAALVATKAKGTVLGGWRPTRRGGKPRLPAGDPRKAAEAASRQADDFASRVGPMAQEMRDQGKSLAAIAAALTEQHIATPRGGAWTATAVRNLLMRADCSSGVVNLLV